MATLANNHLSKYGRFGDTEMYKTSPSGPGGGDLWHVNKEEKSLMNMYGLEGEKLVDAVGSGTINPYTGLEEKFEPMTMIALGSLALGAYSSWKSGSTQEIASKSKISAAESGIASSEEALKKLEESIGAKREVFELEYKKANQDLGRQSGYAYDKSREQHDTLEAKTGMATSGTVARSEEKSRQRLGDETRSKTEDLISQLGRSMGGLMEEFYSEKARLSSEKEKFERELGLAQDQSESGYLGKNVKGNIAAFKGGAKKLGQALTPGGESGYSWGLGR